MLKSYYKLTVLNKNKETIKKGRIYKSRSFLKNFGELLSFFLGRSTGTSLNDIEGNSIAQNNTTGSLICVHSGKHQESNIYSDDRENTVDMYADNIGIVVGTGNTAVSITDFQLATRVDNGTSAGELEYLSSSGTNFDIDTGNDTCSFDLVRIFRNSSGGNIGIQEVGVYCTTKHTASSQNQLGSACIIRDVVSPTVNVGDSEYLKVTYTIQIAS